MFAHHGPVVMICVLCPAAQNVSNAAWAYGCLGVAHPALFDALSAAAKASKLEGYNNQNITDLAWGFAQVGHNVSALQGVSTHA
jgi:hypothetical protein